MRVTDQKAGVRGMASRLVNNGQCLVTIRATAVAIPDSLEAHIRDRVARLARFGWAFTHVSVEVAHERNPRIADNAFIVQITCRSPRSVVRAESAAATAASAFDASIERLHARLRRLADKERSRRAGRSGDNPVVHSAVEAKRGPVSARPEGIRVEAGAVLDSRSDTATLIVREKSHEWLPMTAAEAVDAMELLGHSFYLFIDRDSGEPAVVYQRKAYTYGIVKLGEMVRTTDFSKSEGVKPSEQIYSNESKDTANAQIW